jgi:hypothetical protein
MTVTSLVKDLLLLRRQPDTTPVDTSCDILQVLSESHDFTVHGVSTMILFHCFANKNLENSLGARNYRLLKSFIERGRPLVRSLNDGQQHRANALHIVPEASKRPLTREKQNHRLTDPNFQPVYSVLAESTQQPKTPKELWSLDEDWKLVRGVEKFNGHWRKMARSMDLGSDDRMRNRWIRLVNNRIGKDEEQQAVSFEARRINANLSQTNSTLPRKRRKWPVNSSNTSSSLWTEEEDKQIITAISNPELWKSSSFRAGKTAPWAFLEKKIKTRTKQAIRNRAHRLVVRRAVRTDANWDEEFATESL